MNRIALLGSTGSVGTQTLSVVRGLSGRVQVVALAAGSNVELLSRQIEEFQPQLVHSVRPEDLPPSAAEQATLDDIARDERVDTVVVATSGRAGLSPTLTALRAGKRVALASKEVLVMAGDLVMAAAGTPGASLLPVDSEHSAILQCLAGERSGVHRILLTASGGPFLGLTQQALENVTAKDALSHPVWSMGSKITIDSSTLMNKGLEIIEAHRLFGVAVDHIDVVVHPQCVVHSMVEFVDGSVKAQLGVPDMALPIQFALTYPERLSGSVPSLRWDGARTLDFLPLDESRYPCVSLARRAALDGMTYPAVLCGADEAAVSRFLQGEIRFTDIAHLIEATLSTHQPEEAVSIDVIAAAFDRAREFARVLPVDSFRSSRISRPTSFK